MVEAEANPKSIIINNSSGGLGGGFEGGSGPQARGRPSVRPSVRPSAAAGGVYQVSDVNAVLRRKREAT